MRFGAITRPVSNGRQKQRNRCNNVKGVNNNNVGATCCVIRQLPFPFTLIPVHRDRGERNLQESQTAREGTYRDAIMFGLYSAIGATICAF